MRFDTPGSVLFVGVTFLGRRLASVLSAVLCTAAVFSGCTDDTDRLSEELRGPTIELLADRTAGASLDVTDDGLDCAARRLTDEQANAIAAARDAPELSPELAVAVSSAVLDCVDVDVLTRSAVGLFVIGASETSIDCVVGELNAVLTESLVAAGLAGDELPAAQVELELATALGMCLEADELLDRG